MSNITKMYLKINFRKILPKFFFDMKRILCMCLILFFSNTIFSQSTQEKIKKETNMKNLNALKKMIKKDTLPAEYLKKEAKKRNIPYRKEINGKTYELRGFDKKTNIPIYYSTQTVNKNSLKK